MKLSRAAVSGPFLGLFAVLAVACGTDKSAPRAGASAAPAAAKGAHSRAAAPAPAAAGATETTQGQVELIEGKKMVSFSIELPRGLKDVTDPSTDGRGMKSYAKAAKTFDGYSFQISQGNPRLAALGLEGALAQATKEPEFIKNKAKLLDKGTTASGFYFVHSIVEGKKKAVLEMAFTKKGDVTLQCRGNVEGPLADKPEDAAPVLVAACKSLKITSP